MISVGSKLTRTVLNKLNPVYQLIRDPMWGTPRFKPLIDVIIENNIETVMHAETSLSFADHHACCELYTINLRQQRMKPFDINIRNYAN